jgi:hypothetical protein
MKKMKNKNGEIKMEKIKMKNKMENKMENEMEKNKMEKNKMEKLLSMVFYGADNEETFEKQAIYIVNNMLIYGKIKFELRDIYLEAIKKQFVKHRCVYSSGSHYELCEDIKDANIDNFFSVEKVFYDFFYKKPKESGNFIFMNDGYGKLYIYIDENTRVDTLIFSKDVDENGNIINCWVSKNKEINKLLKQEILINKIRDVFYSNYKKIVELTAKTEEK